MCVICRLDAGTKFDPDFVEVYCKENPHGFGFMWYEDDDVKVINRMGTPEEAKNLFVKFLESGVGFAFHCRLASMGDKNVTNTHPVKIADKKDGDPFSLYMMHNGTMHGYQIDKNMSDTYNFATYYLRPLILKYPDILNEESFVDILENEIGYNKLVFLDSREGGQWLTINSNLGQEFEPGVWISNKTKPSKNYYPLIVRTPQHLGNVMGFLPKNSTKTESGSRETSTGGKQVKNNDNNHNSPGYWDFEEDGRSYFRRIKIKGDNEELWGERDLEEVLTEIGEFDEEKFFDFVANYPYESVDCAYSLGKKLRADFPNIEKKNKQQLLLWAMGDQIEFADTLATMVMYDASN